MDLNNQIKYVIDNATAYAGTIGKGKRARKVYYNPNFDIPLDSLLGKLIIKCCLEAKAELEANGEVLEDDIE